ncbi:hypothetical protein C1H76_4156 [Elsinoe australis]|uniref:Uncharacterized protein n=1 Tax=Elsinoe australis TaxID=40998 RepID=A0A4V6DU85_9PEZI|nr:hypothetical protein C1H76_4156 [Elsinoe australis]
MAEQHESKPSMLPTLPSITTTISSLLQSPIPQSARTEPNTANDRSVASPSTLASFMPQTPTWWRKQAAPKSATTSAANSPETVMFSPVKTPAEEITRRGSDDSIGESAKKRKRHSRPKTSYNLCHAPPRSGGRHKIQVRARPLLQLQKIESRSRPRPAFELLPSAVFSARLIKAIAKFSTSKHGLNPNDLAIVRAERYHAHEASPVEEDETRDILGLICGVTKAHIASTRVRICLEQGVEWEAYQLPTGSYEMTSTDAHGLKRTVRWVPKRNQKGVTSPGVSSPNLTSPIDGQATEKKFNFSTISQNTRRHPVIASLTPSSLEISDIYTLPVPSMSVDSPAPTPMSPAFNRTSSDDTTSSSPDTFTTTEELRNLITATAIYVALCEKWCTSYRSEDSLSRSCSQKSVSPSKPAHSPSKRPTSLSLDNEPVRRSSSLRSALRSPAFRRKDKDAERPQSSNSSLALDTTAIPTIHEGDSPATRRKRADTTSTVIINGNGGQWNPGYEDETDDDDEAQSGEDNAGEEVEEEAKNEKASVRSRTGSSEKKRNFSESTYDGSETSGESVAKEKKSAMAMVSEKPKKKGFLSKLLCGMV